MEKEKIIDEEIKKTERKVIFEIVLVKKQDQVLGAYYDRKFILANYIDVRVEDVKEQYLDAQKTQSITHIILSNMD